MGINEIVFIHLILVANNNKFRFSFIIYLLIVQESGPHSTIIQVHIVIFYTFILIYLE